MFDDYERLQNYIIRIDYGFAYQFIMKFYVESFVTIYDNKRL